ncbi:molecular chaperone [Pseudomonas guariconensis]|uniref:fimbrial biogenesis chaperone n=1 Tax=Pseudomonas guariconensis TaxID=1288410 RepID=UPI0018AC1267|nr:fimbria/pilus periplasmic chaperone [Pseudomonas guariconensis]MBF8740617.1 fimbria/pilus periplasmic chaperone [Pseudomonas guariconensis]MBF8749797.1 fimbria/pilus periplasmic chaperone [Pseudomonas guariconensis]
MNFRLKWRAALSALSIVMMATTAQASVVLSGTRVIYSTQEREVTLKLTNEGQTPVLVQSWIDDGDPNARPDRIKVPFTLTPPLFRLDAHKGQTLRIIHTQEAIPQDRESLFWLNALEVPPRAEGDGASTNKLQLAIRSRIKLFLRPAGLPGTANDAVSEVQWRFVKNAQGGYALAVRNPTPYHVTFSKVSATTLGKTYANEEGFMVAPHATMEVDVGHVTAVGNEIPSQVRYTTVNDYGAAVAGAFHGDAKQK